ncbi:hypothetical protein GCM10027514_24820 [Azotobacter armeniacus]
MHDTIPDLARRLRNCSRLAIFTGAGVAAEGGIPTSAADLPFLAKRRGAFVVEINPQPTPLSRHADLCLHGPAGSILPSLLAALGG